MLDNGAFSLIGYGLAAIGPGIGIGQISQAETQTLSLLEHTPVELKP